MSVTVSGYPLMERSVRNLVLKFQTIPLSQSGAPALNTASFPPTPIPTRSPPPTHTHKHTNHLVPSKAVLVASHAAPTKQHKQLCLGL
jgi:hypothetical protein